MRLPRIATLPKTCAEDAVVDMNWKHSKSLGEAVDEVDALEAADVLELVRDMTEGGVAWK